MSRGFNWQGHVKGSPQWDMAWQVLNRTHLFNPHSQRKPQRERPAPREDWQLSSPEPCCSFQHTFLTFNVKTLANLKNTNKSLRLGNSTEVVSAMACPKNTSHNHSYRALLCQKTLPNSADGSQQIDGKMSRITRGSTEGGVHDRLLAQNRVALRILLEGKGEN